MLKKVFLIYLIGWALIVICSFVASRLEFIQFTLLLLNSSLMLTYFMPQIVKYLFNGKNYEGKYSETLLKFARSHGVDIKTFFVIPSKTNNTHSCGCCGNKIVVFNSKTLELHPFDELEGVMAHEFGHYVNRDQLFYMLILDIILLSTSYINAILFSGAVLTVVFTSLVESALLLPVVLLICQWREHLADVFAKRILDDPGKFVRFFERMIREEEKGNGKKIPSNQNSLQRLLRTHPPIHDRIAFLKQ